MWYIIYIYSNRLIFVILVTEKKFNCNVVTSNELLANSA